MRPLAFEGDARHRLTGLRCERLTWSGSATANGTTATRRALRLRDSSFVIPCDLAVVAKGYEPDPFLRDSTPGLQTDSRHHLLVDEETGRTTRPGVFAGGDGVHGAHLVVTAIAAGKRAAAAIDAYLGQLTPGEPPVALLSGPLAPKQEKKRGWFRRGRGT